MIELRAHTVIDGLELKFNPDARGEESSRMRCTNRAEARETRNKSPAIEVNARHDAPVSDFLLLVCHNERR